MDILISFVCEHCQHAHLILFGLLILAGLNIPISEDVLLIIGGMLASTVLNDQWISLYLWLFAGCYLSAWEAYWLGRLLGPKLFQSRWLKRTFTPQRMEKVKKFYQRHGLLTLLVGRFIPFGVRNGLFMTAGVSKMAFSAFLWRDAIACFISTIVIFYLGYSFGKNYEMLFQMIHHYQRILMVGTGIFIAATILILQIRGRKEKSSVYS